MIFAAVLPLIAVTSALAKPTPAPAKGPLKLTGRSDMVHDPSVAQKADGSYIVVSTSPQGMEIRTSKNKEGPWSFDGNIWPTPPDGVAAFNKGAFDCCASVLNRFGSLPATLDFDQAPTTSGPPTSTARATLFICTGRLLPSDRKSQASSMLPFVDSTAESSAHTTWP